MGSSHSRQNSALFRNGSYHKSVKFGKRRVKVSVVMMQVIIPE